MPILPTRFPVKNHRAASSVPILGIKIKSLAGRQGPLGLDPCPCLWPCPALLPRPCPQNCSRTDQDQRPSFFLCCLSLHVSSGTTSSRKPLLTCLRLSKLLLLWVLQSPRLSNHSIIFGVFAMFPRASLWQTGESVRTPPGFSQSPPSLWYQAPFVDSIIKHVGSPAGVRSGGTGGTKQACPSLPSWDFPQVGGGGSVTDSYPVVWACVCKKSKVHTGNMVGVGVPLRWVMGDPLSEAV